MKKYIILLAGLVLAACESVKEGYGIGQPEQYSRVYIAAAYNGLMKKTFTAPENAVVSVWTNYSGVITLKNALELTLEADMSLVESYNASSGMTFRPLPENCFTLEGNPLSILPGASVSSTPAVVTFLGEQFQDDGLYLLPVTIGSLSDPSLSLTPELATLYISVTCKAGEISISFAPLQDYTLADEEKW